MQTNPLTLKMTSTLPEETPAGIRTSTRFTPTKPGARTLFKTSLLCPSMVTYGIGPTIGESGGAGTPSAVESIPKIGGVNRDYFAAGGRSVFGHKLIRVRLSDKAGRSVHCEDSRLGDRGVNYYSIA